MSVNSIPAARIPAWILIVFFALSPGRIIAQEGGHIAGRVIDAESGLRLQDANVVLQELEVGAATTADGSFRIPGVPSGSYTVAVSLVGYVSWQSEIEVRSGETTTLDVILSPAVVEIPELIVERQSMIGGSAALAAVPGSAHLVSPRALETFKHTDVSRALRTVPGLNIQEEDGYGLRPNIGIRGTGSERSSKISLMEDGVPAAPAPYAAPSAYYFPTVGRMDQIEIRKGSSQIQYGPYTTGGAINLLSTPIPESLSGRFDGNLGSNDNRRAHAWIGQSSGHAGFLAEVYHHRTNGFKQLDSGGDTGFDLTDIVLKGRVNTAPDARIYQALGLKLVRSRELSNETYLGLTASDFAESPLRRYTGSARDQMDADFDQAVLRHLIRPVSGVQITTTGYLSRFHRNWFKLDKVSAGDDGDAVSISNLLANPEQNEQEYLVVTGLTTDPDHRLDLKANNREYVSRGIQSALRFSGAAGLTEHTFEAGVRVHYDEMDRFQWVDAFRIDGEDLALVESGIPGTESNRIESAHATAFYLQDRIEYGALTLHPGLRFEHVTIRRKNFGSNDPERTGSDLSTRSNSVDAWIPGIGVSYRIREQYTFFGGVHRGFAPPGSKQGTRPEWSINYESGVRVRRGTLSADATVFVNDYSNLLGADFASSGGTGSGNQFNGGAALVKGLELSVAQNLGRLTDWKLSLPVQVVYTFTDARFQHGFESEFDPWGVVQDGDMIPYVPRQRATVQTGIESGRFDLMTQFHFVGDMRTSAGQGSIPSDEKIDDHLVVELSAGYELGAGVRVFGVVRNLTDEIYVAARRPAGLRPGLPRMIEVGMSMAF